MARQSTFDDVEPVLFAALAPPGVASYAELAEKTGIPKERISHYLTYLRRNDRKYGWTVPHAPRGRNRTDKRLFAALLNADGELDPDTVNDTNTESLIGGIKGTVSSICGLGNNEARAIGGYVSYGDLDDETTDRLNEIVADLYFIARKAAAVLPFLRTA